MNQESQLKRIELILQVPVFVLHGLFNDLKRLVRTWPDSSSLVQFLEVAQQQIPPQKNIDAEVAKEMLLLTIDRIRETTTDYEHLKAVENVFIRHLAA